MKSNIEASISSTYAAYPLPTMALSQAESNISAQTGIPPLFAQYLKSVSEQLGCTFAIRVGEPFQRYLMPAAPKPSSVKAKNGNWGFTKGVISKEVKLGKIERDETDHKLHQKHRADYEVPKDQATTLHRLSLQEVLAGIKSGDFIRVGTDEDITRTGRLVVKAKDDKAPDPNTILFSLDLNDIQRRIPPIKIERELVKAGEIKYEPQPNWWKKEWGDFEEQSQHYYAAQYKDTEDKAFNDIHVFGVPDGKGNVLPITGDQDLFWISRPPVLKELGGGTFSPEAMQEATRVVNTFTPEGVVDMINARINMQGDNLDLDAITDSAVARLGCITPYESYLIDICNAPFNQDVHHFRDLFQHGAENRNPGKPSPIDAPMLYINSERMELRNNEIEHVEYILTPGFLEKNIIDVHPGWDMAKWGAVVAKQLELNHPVSAATLQSYAKHLEKAPDAIAQKNFDDYMTKTWMPSMLRQLESKQPLPETSLILFKERMAEDAKFKQTYSTFMEQKWFPDVQRLMQTHFISAATLELYTNHIKENPDVKAAAHFNHYINKSMSNSKILPADSLRLFMKNISQPKKPELEQKFQEYMQKVWMPHMKDEIAHQHPLSSSNQQLYNLFMQKEQQQASMKTATTQTIAKTEIKAPEKLAKTADEEPIQFSKPKRP